MKKTLMPDYLFEVSWEVCNKVGGIHTVISTKVPTLVNELKDNYILIGPDVWKETHNNPEFSEDKKLFRQWREECQSDTLRFKIGRWNTKGTPIVILIDFTTLFNIKDKVFTELWEKHKVDSLLGQWDYIEPALFGYAAGMVIESFYNYYISYQDKMIVQFHEWMTGSGILYLKDRVPQAGCVFTTHATVLGRSIAGNNLPLYKNLAEFDTRETAVQFGVMAKYSLEKISAQKSDCFTTVSDLTAKECKYFLEKEPDVITLNGFENSFVPSPEIYKKKKETARKKIFAAAEALLNQKIDNDSALVLISGRYEFKNKGIDVFIDSLARLNKKEGMDKPVLAVIAVPACSGLIDEGLVERMGNPDFRAPSSGYVTHKLYEPENDPVLKNIAKHNLNKPGDKVKVIFVPVYLNGNDGVFNLNYYDFLVGFDLTVFPSYYEPWGYTPLESIAFGIPTITTNLSGFGLWIHANKKDQGDAVIIIERNDDNDAEAAQEIAEKMQDVIVLKEKEKSKLSSEAKDISLHALWKNFVSHYFYAYSIALKKTSERSVLYKTKRVIYKKSVHLKEEQKQVSWRKVQVDPSIPKNLEKLQNLAYNFWWTWNYDAIRIFKLIDEKIWNEVNQNPLMLLDSLSYDQLQALEKNEEFMLKLNKVYAKFEDYMNKTNLQPAEPIAYFCMEYGLHDSLPSFSGGLGILAGDYIKQASDSNINIVGIGLLYRYGYFNQTISITGEQISTYYRQRFSKLPIRAVHDENGRFLKIQLAFPGRTVYARIWRADVGRVPIYLMDTDIDDNNDNDRFITHQLYGGDIENRLKQELLLGIGGIRLLDTLGIDPQIYHCNEGHAAFLNLERLKKFVNNDKLTFEEAIEIARSTTLFTTHTPVPAGHDTFTEDMLRTYLSHYTQHLNISWDKLIGLGRYDTGNSKEKFSVSVLALKLSQEMNGVSKLHGKVSRNMFSVMFNGYLPEELYISHVTNGVHFQTWAAEQWQVLFEKELGKDIISNQKSIEMWQKIKYLPDRTIWSIKKMLKKQLIEYIKKRITGDLTKRQENPQMIFNTIEAIDENSLIICFARRFATYKRASLLFENIDRLARLVNMENMPVIFIFAGKAHPNDKAGQELISKILQISKEPEFIGKIIFIENYNIELAKYMTQGADVWLNTPIRLMEASGTSGEKAAMNGSINVSVLDGWWAEGCMPYTGWGLVEDRTYNDQRLQDKLDAEKIYNILEDEIIPLYFQEDSIEENSDWIMFIKHSIAEMTPRFNMKRMIDEYFEKYYSKLIERSKQLKKNNFKAAKEIIQWKESIRQKWNNIEVLSIKAPDVTKSPLKVSEFFQADMELNLNGIPESEIGVDVVFTRNTEENIPELVFAHEMSVVKKENESTYFACKIPMDKSGLYSYSFRIYPKNKLLAHKQDFNLVNWI